MCVLKSGGWSLSLAWLLAGAQLAGAGTEAEADGGIAGAGNRDGGAGVSGYVRCC